MLWQASVPMAAISQPVVSGGIVFIQGGYDCRSTASVLAAFDTRTGNQMWEAPTTANRYGYSLCGSESAPTVGSGIALTNASAQVQGPPFGGPSFVFGLDPRTGRTLWSVQGEEPAAGAGVAMVLVQAPRGGFNVRALDPMTGRQEWEAIVHTVNIAPSVNRQVILVQEYGCPTSSSPQDIDPSHCSGPGQGGSFASSLDPATGRRLWQVGFGPGSQVNRTPLLSDVTTRLDALDSKTGVLRWRMDNLQVCGLDVAADAQTTVLMLSTASATKILVLNTATGADFWEAPVATTGPYRLAHATVSGGVVYAAVSGKFILPPPSDSG